MSKLSWPRAVSEWNKGQIFRDDLYGIPKKGGEYYDEVKALMAGSRFETQVQTMMGKKPELPKLMEEVKYSPGDYKNNFTQAMRVLLPRPYYPFADEQKKEAIGVLIRMTKAKTNEINQEPDAAIYARKAAAELESIRRIPVRPLSTFVTSPASGKPHAEGKIDLSNLVSLIPEQNKKLLEEFEMQKKQTERQEKKKFEQTQFQKKQEEEKETTSLILKRASEESKQIRREFGDLPEPKKLFQIFKEFDIKDALDFERKKEDIKKKYKTIPIVLKNVYDTTRLWLNYEDFLSNL